MAQNPYQRFFGKDLTLNDYLAIDRTVLSNDRTLLAYGRTALAMVAIGGSCIKFFDSVWIWAIGVMFLVCAVVTSVRGWTRFRRMRAYLSAALRQQTGMPEHPLRDAVNLREDEEKQDDSSSEKESPAVTGESQG